MALVKFVRKISAVKLDRNYDSFKSLKIKRSLSASIEKHICHLLHVAKGNTRTLSAKTLSFLKNIERFNSFQIPVFYSKKIIF